MNFATSKNHRCWALIHAYIDNKRGMWYYLTMESNCRMYLR